MTLWVRNLGKFNWTIFLLHVASTQESAGGGLIWRVHGFTPPLTCPGPGGLGWNCMFMRPPGMEVPGAVNPLHGGSGLPEEVFEETWVEAVKLLMSLPQEF